MISSIFSKWWLWVIVVFVLLSVFTPLGIFLKHLINMQPCNAWETDTSLGWASDCKKNYVCVPRDKSVCEGINTQNAIICGTAFLAEGHTINNPAQGVCKPASGLLLI